MPYAICAAYASLDHARSWALSFSRDFVTCETHVCAAPPSNNRIDVIAIKTYVVVFLVRCQQSEDEGLPRLTIPTFP
jgi:hypothetical protein